jgi:hypothetical protein
MTSGRNATIFRLYLAGTRPAALARQFNISRHRVHQIINSAKSSDAWRAELEAKYGALSNVTALPDETPIEVLCLCKGDIHGWDDRVRHLEYPQAIKPVRTLGDLRRATDAQLLKEPNVGKKMLAELRRFCPRRNPAYGGKGYYRRRSLSVKLKRRDGRR